MSKTGRPPHVVWDKAVGEPMIWFEMSSIGGRTRKTRRPLGYEWRTETATDGTTRTFVRWNPDRVGYTPQPTPPPRCFATADEVRAVLALVVEAMGDHCAPLQYREQTCNRV